MFIVKIDEASFNPFPWDTNGDSVHVEIKHAYSSEGIANGYGFRYLGSKPGALFVTHNGFLAFIWKETKAVLTLQRLDLQVALLKKHLTWSEIWNAKHLTWSEIWNAETLWPC
ncbi:hypothetical protein ACLOJK_023835 [Asimina triloba]